MSASGPYRRSITFADVFAWVGNVPGHRVRCWPPAGCSTPEDLDSLNAESTTLYELVASVVVERAGGADHFPPPERLGRLLADALPPTTLARIVVGRRFQLDRCLVRFPDVALVAADGDQVPALVAEVRHPDNTDREMEIKLAEFARYGVKLVWYVDPERKEVDVYPKGNPKRKKTLGATDTLDGGDVLPGFAVKVARLFESRAPAKKPGRKGKK